MGTGVISNRYKKFTSFEKAKSYVKPFNLNSQTAWYKLTKNKNFPKNIPKYPPNTYKDQWKGWPDFLGKKK